MASSQYFTAVSYCDTDFLHNVLTGMEDDKIILWHMIFPHNAETGEKDHRHIIVMPRKKVDKFDICDILQEFDPNNPLPFRTLVNDKDNSLPDAFLYMLHDVNYLDSKGLVREYHYTLEDIVTNLPFDDLQRRYRSYSDDFCADNKLLRRALLLVEDEGLQRATEFIIRADPIHSKQLLWALCCLLYTVPSIDAALRETYVKLLRLDGEFHYTFETTPFDNSFLEVKK